MFSSPSYCVGLILVVSYSSCAESHVNVMFYRIGGYEFSSSEQSVIQTITDTTTVEVRQMLPTLPASLSLRVQPGQHVDPDTGEAATPRVPDVVYWTVSPTRAGGVSVIARAQLRATLFHPFCYLARRAVTGPVDRLIPTVGGGSAPRLARISSIVPSEPPDGP